MTAPETASVTPRNSPPPFALPYRATVLVLVLLVVALSAAVRLVDLGRFQATVFDEYYYVHDARALAARRSRRYAGGVLEARRRPLRRPPRPGQAGHRRRHRGARRRSLGLAGAGGARGHRPRRAGVPARPPPGADRRVGPGGAGARRRRPHAHARVQAGGARHVRRARHRAERLPRAAVRAGRRSGCGGWWPARPRSAPPWPASGPAPSPSPRCSSCSCRRSCAAGAGCDPLPVVGVLVLVPLGVYLLSSVPYFLAGHGPGDWLRLQEHMATFGWGVKGDRSFASAPATWPFDAIRSGTSGPSARSGTIGLLAIGDFLLWWASIAAWVSWALLAVLRRDWRLGIVPAIVGVLYLPWLLTTRQTYIYYMVPVVPFLAVLVATALARIAGAPWALPPGEQAERRAELPRRRPGRGAASAAAAGSPPGRSASPAPSSAPVRAVRARRARPVRLLRVPDALHDLEVSGAGSSRGPAGARGRPPRGRSCRRLRCRLSGEESWRCPYGDRSGAARGMIRFGRSTERFVIPERGAAWTPPSPRSL